MQWYNLSNRWLDSINIKSKNKQMENKNKGIILGLLFAIIIGAFLVRFIGISDLPAGLYPDEAVNGMDALEANATGNYKLFYESNNGREGLFINLQAFSIKLLGNNLVGLKLWSIIFGTLTVLGMFLLISEIFRNQRAGLIGAYLTAFSYWAINFSRIGFRANMLPFILVFAFYFLFKGIRSKKYYDFLLAGLIYGLGLHTYIAFRVSPLVLIVLLIGFIITRKNFLVEYWKFILTFAMAMFITAAPMLLDFFYFHPEHYSSRTSEISVLNPEVNQGHIFQAVGKTLFLSIAKYNLWGDQNWRHNYPPYPLLNPITGIAFALGFLYSIFKFFHLLYLRFKKGVRDDHLHIYLFLLTWFFTLLIPEVLANEGNPHALRSIGTLPVVMIFAAIPLTWILGKAKSFGHSFKLAIYSLLIASFIFIGISDPVKYFVFFAESPQQHASFDANLTEEAKYILSLPSETQKIVIAENMERVPIKFLTNQAKNVTYKYKAQVSEIGNVSNTVILMNDKDENVISQLQSRFPNLQLETMTNEFGDTFYILK
jgi:4-amino-4-deoxy-L-arabinose transferase-like glycosyltransferase